MAWSDLSSWLKGGIIGFVLGIFLYGVAQADLFGCNALFPGQEFMCSGEKIFAGEFSLLFWTLFGAFVGGIIGKIKFSGAKK